MPVVVQTKEEESQNISKLGGSCARVPASGNKVCLVQACFSDIETVSPHMESSAEEEPSEDYKRLQQRYNEAVQKACSGEVSGMIAIGHITDYPQVDFNDIDLSILIRYGTIFVCREPSYPHSAVQGAVENAFRRFLEDAAEHRWIALHEWDVNVQNTLECHAEFTKRVDVVIADRKNFLPIVACEIGVFNEDVVALLVEASMCLRTELCQFFFGVKVNVGEQSSIRVLLCKKQEDDAVADSSSSSEETTTSSSSSEQSGCSLNDYEKPYLRDQILSGAVGKFLDIVVLSNEVFFEGDAVKMPFPAICHGSNTDDTGFTMIEWDESDRDFVFDAIRRHFAKKRSPNSSSEIPGQPVG